MLVGDPPAGPPTQPIPDSQTESGPDLTSGLPVAPETTPSGPDTSILPVIED